MSRFLARKELSGLSAVDTAGEEALRKLKFGDVVSVEVKKPRNGKHHRLYWALISKVWENQERYETPELLHTAIKLAAGHYDVLQMPSGAEYRIPKSTSFEDMDQVEFSAYYDRVCDLIARHFLPGVSIDALKAEVESMIGARAA